MKLLHVEKTDVDVVTASSDHSKMYLENAANLVLTENNDLMSVSSKPSSIVKAINNMGKSQGILTYVSNDNVKRKLFNIMNAKLVKKNGKRMVKMEVSTEKIKATGKCAKEAIKIKNFSAKYASLNITSLSSENNLLLPGVAANNPPQGLQFRPSTQGLGNRVEFDIGNQSIVRITDTDGGRNTLTFSMASWDEETLTLRIWLRHGNFFRLNIAVFPAFLLMYYNPLPLRVDENGRLTLQNSNNPISDAGIRLSFGPNIETRNPCGDSSQNCLRLR